MKTYEMYNGGKVSFNPNDVVSASSYYGNCKVSLRNGQVFVLIGQNYTFFKGR